MEAKQIISLNLSVAQVNVILAALGKQPLEAVIDVYAVVRDQTMKQANGKTEIGAKAKGTRP